MIITAAERKYDLERWTNPEGGHLSILVVWTLSGMTVDGRFQYHYDTDCVLPYWFQHLTI